LSAKTERKLKKISARAANYWAENVTLSTFTKMYAYDALILFDIYPFK